jgi:hypothetical protein
MDESQIARIVRVVYGRMQGSSCSDFTGQFVQSLRAVAVSQTAAIMALIPLLREWAAMSRSSLKL